MTLIPPIRIREGDMFSFDVCLSSWRVPGLGWSLGWGVAVYILSMFEDNHLVPYVNECKQAMTGITE